MKFPIKSRWFRVPMALGVLYVGICVMVFGCQDKLIFPGQATQGQADATLRPGGANEIVRLKTSQGDEVAMLYAPALSRDGTVRADAPEQPTLLFFYGNGTCMAYCADLARAFQRLGVNVAMPDYAGYGMSSGKPSEASLYATADAAYDHVTQVRHADPARIVPVGWSLGGGVAIDLASRRQVGAIITISAFTSLADMARGIFPWLPTGWLVRHRFENEAKIATLDLPTLIIHGRHDAMIPHAMSDRLAAAAKGRVTRLSVETDHNDIFEADEEIFPAVEALIAPLRTAGQ